MTIVVSGSDSGMSPKTLYLINGNSRSVSSVLWITPEIRKIRKIETHAKA